VAIRVFDHDGRGGFKGAAPQLGTDRQHLSLQGDWQFRTGDDVRWGSEPLDPGTSDLAQRASFSRVEEGAVPRGSAGHKMAGRGEPLTPAESARSFTVPEDLEFEQVLAEPLVRQPVFLNFDERGRMWVVQYIQYPAPAGLNVVSKDVWWRAVYDKVPEPPPRGVRGEDKITIHEDTDGDGKFDKHTTFVDGLNIATAVAQGRGGVWVLNPPYLLFYPDANHDDVPDGPPVVHLEGFGLEDTHSVINSLRWGSDGWLYAAQGSTVTGRVRAPATTGSAPTNVVLSQGQNIWRYHPETHRYEIFAEGGGNAFGVEMDDKGRVYSGHNGGDTRGFHYTQGAYLRKGFEKHGELSNPYAFGYFPNMTGTPGERFTHNFVINHGGALPARYDGMLFGVEPLQGRVVLSEITPEGSTFQTRDLERVVTSRDSWFRPVDIKVGPDGAIYVCDWYDRQVTHTRNQEGNIDTSNGRIYRLRAKGSKPLAPFNLAALSNEQLIGLLNHSNTWFRQTIQRLIADRHEATLGPRLQQLVAQSSGQLALEALWACHSSGGLTEAAASSFLEHPEPQVRLWTVRLLGDDLTVSPGLLRQFVELAGREPNVEVRAQLAATAQRLPAADGLAIVGRLALHDEDVKDPRMPLLCWWAMEKPCEAHRDAVLRLFEDSAFWNRPMVEQHLLERVMRRFAAAGARRDLLTCARLLELAPLREHSERLMKGFEAAYQGRSMAGVPEEVIQAMARHGVGSPAFRLRQGAPEALPQALKTIADAKANRQERQRFVQILGEVRQPAAVPALLQLVEQPADAELRRSALNALAAYDELDIGRRVAAVYPALTGDVRTAAQTLLSSRTAWSLQLVQAVDRGQVRPLDVPREIVAQMKLHKDSQLAGLLRRYWPEPATPGGAAWQSQIQHFGDVLKAGKGDPYRGQVLFNASCASCHTLFARGGHVGPDLTSYQRSDLDFLLLNIVNPSAQIREGYENFVVETKDDRTMNGFLVERDSRLVVLRGLDGQNITLERKDIVDLRAASLSLMPEGLLDALSDQQVRDLFAFLRSTQPLAN
jgi:putative heme-binding domain-containing protein